MIDDYTFLAVKATYRRIFADDITGNSFVIEMAFLQSNLCWAGDRKTRQTSQLQSNIFYEHY